MANSNLKKISHEEICKIAAGVLGKDFTSESVDKVSRQYAASTISAIKEHLPEKVGDQTVAATVMGAFICRKKDTGTVKNADGSTSKIGANYTLSYAAPKTWIKEINIDFVVDTVKTVGSVVKTVADAVKAA